MTKKIIIGSRGSKLALLYAQKAKEQIITKTTLDTNDIEIKSISTKGDQVKDTRLSDIGGKGLFSTEIEKELENKSIDIAVHALSPKLVSKLNYPYLLLLISGVHSQ